MFSHLFCIYCNYCNSEISNTNTQSRTVCHCILKSSLQTKHTELIPSALISSLCPTNASISSPILLLCLQCPEVWLCPVFSTLTPKLHFIVIHCMSVKVGWLLRGEIVCVYVGTIVFCHTLGTDWLITILKLAVQQ